MVRSEWTNEDDLRYQTHSFPSLVKMNIFVVLAVFDHAKRPSTSNLSDEVESQVI